MAAPTMELNGTPGLSPSRSRRLSRRGKVGLPPGSVLYVGEPTTEPVRLDVLRYDAEQFEEHTDLDIAGVQELANHANGGVLWLNVSGVHNEQLLHQLGELFAIDSLVLEDVTNLAHRPKLDDLGDKLFVILKMLTLAPETYRPLDEQISLLVTDQAVISFQQWRGDLFDPVRRRIRTGRGRIRRMGPDYLAYALIDAVVDNYFVLLEDLETFNESLERQMLEQRDATDTIDRLYHIRHDVSTVRRAVWPLREITATLRKMEHRLLDDALQPFLGDLHDHINEVNDAVDAVREHAAELMNLHLSHLSTRMNEVMKVLTIIATIFIPLSWLAGVYGMNFQHMPELQTRYGYFVVLGVMGAVVVALLGFFRYKRWL